MPLDPDDLRRYAARDWSGLEAQVREERARMSIPQKVALAIALYEAARATRPGWPSDEDRLDDLACHQRVQALLQRAAHVGRR